MVAMSQPRRPQPYQLGRTQDSLGDDFVHDLVGAAADALQASVAERARNAGLLQVTRATPYLHARVDEPVLYLRAELLGHRDLGYRILVVHDAPRGGVEQRARGFELGRGVGELVRDHLV